VSASRPGSSLPPGKTRYPLHRRLGGPQGRSGQVRKISPPTGIRSPDRSACSPLLYRLSYSGPHITVIRCKIMFFFKTLNSCVFHPYWSIIKEYNNCCCTKELGNNIFISCKCRRIDENSCV
jgi:hypothetical protein